MISSKKFIFLIAAIFLINFGSAAHYIVGYVGDSSDGLSFADGREVVVWNPANISAGNVTDIVGPSGNSGTNNIYLIDCELLSTPCNVGDILTVDLVSDGSEYNSRGAINVTVTGEGFDLANNLSMNSPPKIFANFPGNLSNLSYSLIDFNCSALDTDADLKNISLYGNFTGSWHRNNTLNVSGQNNQSIVQLNLTDNIYSYSCEVYDTIGSRNYTQNLTFKLDTTAPNISQISLNSTYSCGDTGAIQVGCNITDSLSQFTAIIFAITPVGQQNYTTIFQGGNFYTADIALDEYGEWNFSCYANDSLGNIAQKYSPENYSVLSNSSSDLYLNASEINFSTTQPIENQPVYIQATVYNLGCGNASNVKVAFYLGDPNLGGNNLGNDTINVQKNLTNLSRVSWLTQIGLHNIFVRVDPDNQINELNETDNNGNKTLSVTAWQEFYGNLSMDFILGKNDYKNISAWFNATSLAGNIFVSDIENNIDWTSLLAIGRTKIGSIANNDFAEIDSFLSMTGYNDSIYTLYTTAGVPNSLENITIHQELVSYVPVINSTDNFNFSTGILWDSADSVDNEYDSSEKEDIVFISQINSSKIGKYGEYDYEIKMPARLREYRNTDVNEVYFYYDIN